MNAENPFPKRKPTRLAGFDYNNAGAYFITVCTQSRKNLLSHVVGAIHESPVIKLTAYGQILQDILDKIPARFGVLVDQYVIMPNHI
ncbi:MAG: transposase, partial [Clostridia bacterium]|nr:transposase [Clostridia bacterium]